MPDTTSTFGSPPAAVELNFDTPLPTDTATETETETTGQARNASSATDDGMVFDTPYAGSKMQQQQQLNNDDEAAKTGDNKMRRKTTTPLFGATQEQPATQIHIS